MAKQPNQRTGKTAPGESVWRYAFFVSSAAMAAFAAVDLEAGRWAGALGDFGVACLLLSLTQEFPLMRLLIEANRRPNLPQAREKLLREAVRLRAERPWVERLRSTGWTVLLVSIGLRFLGLA